MHLRQLSKPTVGVVVPEHVAAVHDHALGADLGGRVQDLLQRACGRDADPVVGRGDVERIGRVHVEVDAGRLGVGLERLGPAGVRDGRALPALRVAEEELRQGRRARRLASAIGSVVVAVAADVRRVVMLATIGRPVPTAAAATRRSGSGSGETRVNLGDADFASVGQRICDGGMHADAFRAAGATACRGPSARHLPVRTEEDRHDSSTAGKFRLRIPSSVAARAVDVRKIYGEGDATVAALDGVSIDFAAGEFTAVMGPSGSGKSTLMHCMAALDTVTSGEVLLGDADLSGLDDKKLTNAAPRQDRLRLPGVQPGADADGPGEHRAAAVDRRPQARPGLVRHRDRHRRPPRPAQPPAQRAVRAASSSGWPVRAPWCHSPRSSSPTSRPATSTRTSGAEVLGFLRRSVDEYEQTIVMVTHDPVAAGVHRPRGLPRRRQGRRRAAQPDVRRGAREDEACSATRAVAGTAAEGLIAHVESHLAQPGRAQARLALSAFAIVLGVAFVAGSFIFTDALSGAFNGIVKGTTADVEVAPEGGRRLRRRPGHPDLSAGDRRTSSSGFPDVGRSTATSASQNVYVIGSDGKLVGGNGPPGLAFNYNDMTSITGDQIITLAEGELPHGPDQIALDESTADKAGYQIGDEVTLVPPSGRPDDQGQAHRPGRVRLERRPGRGDPHGLRHRRASRTGSSTGKDVYTERLADDRRRGLAGTARRPRPTRCCPTAFEAEEGDKLAKKNEDADRRRS